MVLSHTSRIIHAYDLIFYFYLIQNHRTVLHWATQAESISIILAGLSYGLSWHVNAKSKVSFSRSYMLLCSYMLCTLFCIRSAEFFKKKKRFIFIHLFRRFTEDIRGAGWEVGTQWCTRKRIRMLWRTVHLHVYKGVNIHLYVHDDIYVHVYICCLANMRLEVGLRGPTATSFLLILKSVESFPCSLEGTKICFAPN